jgi:hypothetical protein
MDNIPDWWTRSRNLTVSILKQTMATAGNVTASIGGKGQIPTRRKCSRRKNVRGHPLFSILNAIILNAINWQPVIPDLALVGLNP